MLYVGDYLTGEERVGTGEGQAQGQRSRGQGQGSLFFWRHSNQREMTGEGYFCLYLRLRGQCQRCDSVGTVEEMLGTGEGLGSAWPEVSLLSSFKIWEILFLLLMSQILIGLQKQNTDQRLSQTMKISCSDLNSFIHRSYLATVVRTENLR